MIQLSGEIITAKSTAILDVPDVRLDVADPVLEEVFGSLLEDLEPGAMLLDRLQYGMVLGSASLKNGHTAQFVEQSEFAKGRQASMNGVYFGQLSINTASGLSAPEFVAVKPYCNAISDPAPVVHEWSATNFLNSIDPHERAYIPLGVWRQESGIYQLITLYDHPVLTYDNVFWAQGEDAERITASQIDQALIICMFGLGLLHGVNAAHRDSRAKNLASDRRRVRFVDLEMMSMLPEGETVNGSQESAAELILADLEMFAGSCLQGNGVDDGVVDTVKARMARRVVQASCSASYNQGKLKSAKGNSVSILRQRNLTTKRVAHLFEQAIDMT